MQRRHIVLAALTLVAVMAGHDTRAGDESPRSLEQLTVDRLRDLEVTSVSKRRAPLAEAPTSNYVITAESMRRAPSHTLPVTPRLAPHLQVAQIELAYDDYTGVETLPRLHDGHREFDDVTSRSRIERSVPGEVRWSF